MTKNLGFVGALAIAFASACGGGGGDSDNTCGDGMLGGNEQCDDGNTADGDGCSSTCTTEQASTCGDGTIDVNSGEQCDDGNTVNNDGCSSSCQNESPSNCGNGHIDTGETCDDSNQVSGDGCSSFCQLEDGGTSGSCQAPLEITLVDGMPGASSAHVTGNTTNGMNHFTAATCGGSSAIGDGFDLQYKLVIAAKSNVTIRTGSTGPDLVLRLTTAACDEGTVVTDGCADLHNATAPENLNLKNLAAGTYYLDVDGFDNTEFGAFSFDVTVKLSLCGDGNVDPGEGCDDSNNVSGDGCSATCHDESAGGCANPSEVVLDDMGDGDYYVEFTGDTSTGENEFAASTCDGTDDVGGGKDVTYSFELPAESDVYIDMLTNPSFHSNIRLTTAGCDPETEVIADGESDGCAANAFYGDTWYSLPAGTYYLTIDGVSASDAGAFDIEIDASASDCGDGYVDYLEDCDDGNLDEGDGCSARCFVEDGFVCDLEDPSTCIVDVCGNGMVDNGEQCDDGARVSGDGCSKTCQLESGYACTGTPSVCTPKCGNGMIDSGETCDDGDKDSGDGCSSTCQLEAGYTCSGAPSVCMTRCGNSQIDTGETCDDGDADAGDGCSATCQVETGYLCSGLPSVCTLKCGNGIIESGETCDDGDTTAGDGCSDTCQKEPGYTCVGLPSTCTTKCGNNILDAGETCDDGNAMAGDGCSNVCVIEYGYTCTPALPSTCTAIPKVCGDGMIQIGENCDDSNATADDGCSATCMLEFDVTESAEPNDTVPQTLTAGNHRIKGSFTSNADVDLYTFTLTAPAMLTLETYTGIDASHAADTASDGNPDYDCNADPSRDTIAYLYNGTGTSGTSVENDDDSGTDRCSFFETSSLAAGTYTVKVYSFSSGHAGDYYVDLHFN